MRARAVAADLEEDGDRYCLPGFGTCACRDLVQQRSKALGITTPDNVQRHLGSTGQEDADEPFGLAELERDVAARRG